jgi:hypothetical protein
MRKIHLAVVALAVWLSVVAAFMLLAERVDLEIFFVLWLIGILVIVELIDTRFSQPRHLRYMKYLIAIGIVIFGWIVAQKVLEILSR